MISVCMPYWMRQAALDASLGAYRSVYEDRALEVSIADDGSPESVRAPGCIVTTLPAKTIGLNACVPMNVAVRASTGDIVVLTNPEIVHREDVFSGMLALLERPDDVVTVSCRDVAGMWLAGPQVDYSKGGRMPVPPRSHFHFCQMMRRELFDRVDGFDEAYRHGRSCEDNDWLWTLYHAGARFRTAPGTVWHHRTPHAYAGTLASNRDLLTRKWGHLWKT